MLSPIGKLRPLAAFDLTPLSAAPSYDLESSKLGLWRARALYDPNP